MDNFRVDEQSSTSIFRFNERSRGEHLVGATRLAQTQRQIQHNDFQLDFGSEKQHNGHYRTLQLGVFLRYGMDWLACS